MPNHVSNIVIADPEVIAGLVRERTEQELADHEKYEENRRERIVKRDGDAAAYKREELPERIVDFNLVIPIPDDDDPRITATKSDIGGTIVGWSMDGLSPMDFARKLWGTKWNAYSQVLDDRTDRMQFETAWAHPFPVIEALSKNFPDHEIEVKYADEDFGHNLGHYKIKNGEYTFIAEIEDGSDEAYEFASLVRYEKPYSEVKAEWDQDEIDSARKAMFCKRIESERGEGTNGYQVIREEGLEVPQDILDTIITVEDVESFWEGKYNEAAV